MESYDHSGGINLVCESRGWNPEPEVLWMNREGDTLPAEDTQMHRDTEGFSVKHRITVYDYSDSNKFYCRLLQKHHMMEAEVIINSKVFDAWKWVVGISVSACLIAVGWIVTAVIYHKKELQKEKENAEIQTANGSNISTRSVHQELHEIGFHGQAAAHKPKITMCNANSILMPMSCRDREWNTPYNVSLTFTGTLVLMLMNSKRRL
ncbi:butyrophilin subfamily 1 member A1-like [Ictalurus furcatus]|uniref:butyrophilin subfamily 1 member A1-like n=1 Tax=Ictalurus furcatus TaxID=66913 RepID=UPI00234FF24C|nr:butyrophilin subfamily 1 member A1-like [Ictalurus furcatus]